LVKLTLILPLYVGKDGTIDLRGVPAAGENCGNYAGGLPLGAVYVWRLTPFISNNIHQRTIVFAEQKPAPALVHRNRGRMFHLLYN
jgi:hypothetical protein